MRKITVTMTESMVKELEREMEDRGLASIAQAIRIVLGEHFSQY